MNPFRFACFAGLLALLLAGCATPEKRIQQNQEVFDSFPVAAQARLRGGQIDLGFTPDMVRIALGEPQRKLVRRSAEGDAEIWLYLDLVRHYERQRADITLDRPPYNVVSMLARDQLRLVFEALDEDDRVRIIVVAGKGEHFSSGGNIKGFLEASPEHVSHLGSGPIDLN